MSYKQTVLDRKEWEEALEQSKRDLVNLGTSLMVSGDVGPAPEGHREKILCHIESMARDDPGYAWWAEHVYEQAFASVLVDNPYANLTRDLRARMKAKKTQSQEKANGHEQKRARAT